MKSGPLKSNGLKFDISELSHFQKVFLFLKQSKFNWIFLRKFKIKCPSKTFITVKMIYDGQTCDYSFNIVLSFDPSEKSKLTLRNKNYVLSLLKIMRYRQINRFCSSGLLKLNKNFQRFEFCRSFSTKNDKFLPNF